MEGHLADSNTTGREDPPLPKRKAVFLLGLLLGVLVGAFLMNRLEAYGSEGAFLVALSPVVKDQMSSADASLRAGDSPRAAAQFLASANLISSVWRTSAAVESPKVWDAVQNAVLRHMIDNRDAWLSPVVEIQAVLRGKAARLLDSSGDSHLAESSWEDVRQLWGLQTVAEAKATMARIESDQKYSDERLQKVINGFASGFLGGLFLKNEVGRSGGR